MNFWVLFCDEQLWTAKHQYPYNTIPQSCWLWVSLNVTNMPSILFINMKWVDQKVRHFPYSHYIPWQDSNQVVAIMNHSPIQGRNPTKTTTNCRNKSGWAIPIVCRKEIDSMSSKQRNQEGAIPDRQFFGFAFEFCTLAISLMQRLPRTHSSTTTAPPVFVCSWGTFPDAGF